jgi:geranylgeranyl pyrophosphate synthase
LARESVRKAKTHLKLMPNSEWKETLCELADFAIVRKS